jgi:hypothetical protein
MSIFFTSSKAWPQVVRFFAIVIFVTAKTFAPGFHYLIRAACALMGLLAIIFWNSNARRKSERRP